MVKIILYCIAGIILITAGKRLFWLFVACAGFIAGFEYGDSLRGIPNQWIIVLIAFGMGLAGALLAVFIQGVAVGVAGFLLGGYASVNLLGLMEILTRQYFWPAFVIGGIIGMLLMIAFFDYALIFLSSIAGACLIVQAIPFSSPVKIIIFLVLAMAGAAYQTQAQQKASGFRDRGLN